jgi:hypothetical protein
VITLILGTFGAWALFALVAYLLDDQAHGRRWMGGAR